jgi:hypothetical protein
VIRRNGTLRRISDVALGSNPSLGAALRFRRVQTLVREGSPLAKLRNSALLRRPPPVPFALGETVELQHDTNVIGHHQRLDLAPQAAQAERHDGRPQLGRAGDVAAFVKRDTDFKTLAMSRCPPSITAGMPGRDLARLVRAKFRLTDPGAPLPVLTHEAADSQRTGRIRTLAMNRCGWPLANGRRMAHARQSSASRREIVRPDAIRF